MKNPVSLQALTGFEQMPFLPDQDSTPESCPKFPKCNAMICPLDTEWRKRVLLNGEPTCFYLTESVKDAAETVFKCAGLEALYELIVRATPNITAQHPRIRNALERAKLKGFRMTCPSPSCRR